MRRAFIVLLELYRSYIVNVSDHIFENINEDNQDKIWCDTRPQYSEVNLVSIREEAV